MHVLVVFVLRDGLDPLHFIGSFPRPDDPLFVVSISSASHRQKVSYFEAAGQ